MRESMHENEGSTLQIRPLSANHIWTPPARKGDCGRDLELGCSHISGLLVGLEMKPGPRWIPARFVPYQSGGLAGHGWRQSLEAPVRPVHHQRHNKRTLRNLGKSGFQAPTSVFAHTQFCAPRSLNRGWRAGAQNCARGYVGRAVTVTSGEHRPQYPRILVGQCDRGHVRSALPRRRCAAPTHTARVALALSERGARPVNQQGAQIAVTACLVIPEQHGLAARGMLARNQPQK